MTVGAGTRVLLTGATGFIGANLARSLLERGARVFALVRPASSLWRIASIADRLELLRADLTDAEAVRRAVDAAAPGIVFHAAAGGVHHPRTAEDRLATVRSTVVGTASLLEAVRPVPFRRFVCLGSSLEYGPRDRPLRETDRLEPTTERGATKAAATLLATRFARADRRPLTVLRLFSVYGPWERPDRLVPTAIRAALDGATLPLTAGEHRRDLVFVDDVVDACLRAAETALDPGEIVNIGTGRQWTNREVVERVRAVTGTALEVREGAHPSSPSDTGHWVADIGKAERTLGWAPAHDLEAGLGRFIDWVRRMPGYASAGAEA